MSALRGRRVAVWVGVAAVSILVVCAVALRNHLRVEYYLRQVSGGDGSERTDAIEGLRSCPMRLVVAKVRDKVSRGLSSPDLERKKQAVFLAQSIFSGELGREAVPVILDDVRDADMGRKLFGFSALWHLNVSDMSGRPVLQSLPASTRDECVRVLMSQLGSDDALVRGKAAFYLGEIGEASRPAIPALEALLTDETVCEWRLYEADSGERHPEAKYAYTDQVGIVHMQAPVRVREQAAEALKEIRAAASPGTPR